MRPTVALERPPAFLGPGKFGTKSRLPPRSGGRQSTDDLVSLDVLHLGRFPGVPAAGRAIARRQKVVSQPRDAAGPRRRRGEVRPHSSTKANPKAAHSIAIPGGRWPMLSPKA
eukprot:1649270-Prymnesium_polylepis.3